MNLLSSMQLAFHFLLCAAVVSCSSSVPRADPLDLPTGALEGAVCQVADDSTFEVSGWPSERWWELFSDDQLSHFIETTIERNPTLQIARENILGAAYSADRVRAVLYPNVTWMGDVSRQKFSKTGLIPFTGLPLTPGLPPVLGGPLIPEYFTQWEKN